ncbi:MAG: hypothetical protein LBK82_16980 [Planctomycetaceae bacterium]|nr:hypothetical protein [Planctomycetaceae bacterium]
MLSSVLESMPTQPARPFSEGIAHLFHDFSCIARLKRTFYAWTPNPVESEIFFIFSTCFAFPYILRLILTCKTES